MLRKLLFVPPILIGAAIVYLMASGREAPQRKPVEEIARAVRAVSAEPVRLVPRVRGFGSVYPGTVWSAIAQVGGEAVFVHPDLKKGAIMAGGTQVVRIAPQDYELAISQAEANIRSAQARLAELQVSEQNTEALLDIEKRTLDLQEAELKRQQDLFGRGTVAQSRLETQQRDVLAQRKKVQDLENTQRLLPTQRTVQREQIAVYEAQLASARLNLERTVVDLPFDGRIGEVQIEQGQFVQTGGTLFTADSLDVAEVEAQVPISQFRAMIVATHADGVPQGISAQSLAKFIERIGFEATVRLRAGEEIIEWPARFARMSSTIDPKTRTVGVIVAVDGAYAQASPGGRPPLTKGMFVEIEVRTKPHDAVLVVPRSAIRDGHLYIADGDQRLRIVAVKVGLEQGDLAVIREGLESGDRVIVSDLSPAIEGMLLRVEEDAMWQQRLADQAGGAQ